MLGGGARPVRLGEEPSSTLGEAVVGNFRGEHEDAVRQSDLVVASWSLLVIPTGGCASETTDFLTDSEW